ncbi:hypothetical protein MJO28_007478 [Puccinia striiformis f. sp. tritici]|uniref:Carbonic anhydrase n=4 Tax=Puccinia striiformis TaxID=27350 RepID=A0A0L0VW51_9BASI|nr:hypothetical protein Pst134EA_013589 [Puccinia striiformis f. sp. tritici]KAI9603977.1 hypothetical protein H4Q26_003586 [Puccinia striiformis f. sp. tritici PST-130]KNF03529.1 hypothetical protein PSTG_03464 [Puccinia striiformis f. sp. tritici PST-78]POW11509.1 hypothetical protein PSTT_05248 [Puccinia striiformis]KAH9454499.1 hypothetical protein Pst134EB_014577 [Puccinia striiformis f. sp. tritici]KAH9465718.1 hypothetical protein Pst134EA_013589 [Puccinia striiformis f. sp. tritici]
MSNLARALCRRQHISHRSFSSSTSTGLPVLKKLLDIMSKPESKTVPFAPSSPTLTNFLDRNHQFASTCDPEVLATTCKGQSPSVFWLGCSDSRVPEGVVIQAGLGEVFVHRNVANVFNHEDTSATAALAYAVNHLKVTHVVVVGHESCGGCAAALAAATAHKPEEPAPATPTDKGEAAIAKWIEPIQTLAFKELEKKDDQFSLPKLITLNVESQVRNIIHHEIIQKAWARGQTLSVHGWVYKLSSGKVQDLGLTQSKP